MRRTTALRLLPATHARVLDLTEEGLTPDEVAARLGLETSAVGPLLRVARSKLAALEARDEPIEAAEWDATHATSGEG